MNPLVLARRVAVVALWPAALSAQVVVCPSGTTVPYFGWDATDCGRCNVYGTYLEYLTTPVVRDIRADGPAAGRLQSGDTLLAVDGQEITTAAAWHRMRDAEPGRPLRFSVRRGSDSVTTTIAPSARCAPAREAPAPRIVRLDRPGDGRGASRARSFVIGNVTVDISGSPESVRYDPASGEAVITAGDAVVRITPKRP